MKITGEEAKLGPYKPKERWYLPSDYFWAIGGDMGFGERVKWFIGLVLCLLINF